jgi:hypothetical protein
MPDPTHVCFPLMNIWIVRVASDNQRELADDEEGALR